MTTSELAAKIAEEIFRTIERESAIVKAEIIDAVEKVLAQEKARETPHPPMPATAAMHHMMVAQLYNQSMAQQNQLGGLGQSLAQGSILRG